MASSVILTPTRVTNVKVVHIRKLGFDNLEKWCSDSNNVYIGRGGVVFINKIRYPKSNSKWANPYTVKKYGRSGALREYYDNLYKSGLVKDIEELRGKTLGCWCVEHPYTATPGIPIVCHGQILTNILAGLEVTITSDV